jgi:hypothetical protein
MRAGMEFAATPPATGSSFPDDDPRSTMRSPHTIGTLLALVPAALAQDPCGTWSAIPTPNDPNSTSSTLNEIAVIAPDDVWAVGRKYVPAGTGMETQTLAMHWDGAAWTIVPSPSPSPYPGGGWADFQSVHAVSSNDVWAAGGKRIQAPDGFVGTHLMVQRWNGSSWSVLNTPVTIGGSGNFIDDIEVVANDDIWFVGDWLEFPPANVAEKRALAMHWNGSSFTIHDTPFFNNANIGGHGLTAISAVSSNDIWAVGGGHDGDYVDFSYIVHWNGQQWGYVPGPTAGWFHRLYDVHAVASDEVYAVGDYQDASGYHGLCLRWNGTSWTRLPDPPVGGSSIEVLGPNQVYVGGGGVALWNGVSWSVVTTFPGVSIPSIWSLERIGPCALWGSGGTWTTMLEPLTVRLDPNGLGTPYCVVSPNSAGPGALMSATGSASVAQQNLTLRASQCPAGTAGLFVYGSTQVQQPLGNGILCVGGSLHRLPVVFTSSTGTAAHLLSYVSSPILPSSTWNFQFWFRDLQGGAPVVDLSNGLRVLFTP